MSNTSRLGGGSHFSHQLYGAHFKSRQLFLVIPKSKTKLLTENESKKILQRRLCALYFRMLCLHINMFGLVVYTQQLVLCL